MRALYYMFTMIICITGTDIGPITKPNVVPQNTIAQEGTVVRFNCTALQPDPVYWTTRPYGSRSTQDIYIGEQYLMDKYGRSGRFAVEVNSTERRYDLVIKDVMQKDGGVYICIDGRGLGKKAYSELVVFGHPICQEHSPRRSYMGHNVLDLSPDVMHFSCRMNYSGNLRPRFLWSIGDKTFEGTTGNEAEITASSLEIVPSSMLNNAVVSWEVIFEQDSVEGGRTGILWTSAPLQIHFAEWTNKDVVQCPGVYWTLICNPICSYELISWDNGTRCCLMNYSTGNDFNLVRSCVDAVSSSDSTGFSNDLIVALVIALSSAIIGILVGYLFGKKCKPFKSWLKIRKEKEPSGHSAIEMEASSNVNERNEETAAEITHLMISNAVKHQGHSEDVIPSASDSNSTNNMQPAAKDKSDSGYQSHTDDNTITTDAESTRHSPATT